MLTTSVHAPATRLIILQLPAVWCFMGSASSARIGEFDSRLFAAPAARPNLQWLHDTCFARKTEFVNS
jgi:hypothetical protein